MTAKDVKQVQEALGHVLASLKVEKVDLNNAVKFVTAFEDRNGEFFTFYAYTRPGAKTLFLTDAGLILKTLNKSGMGVEMKLLQALLRSYDLIITEEGSVVDLTDRPLWQRVTALFQAWCAADGVLRTWTRPKG